MKQVNGEMWKSKHLKKGCSQVSTLTTWHSSFVPSYVPHREQQAGLQTNACLQTVRYGGYNSCSQSQEAKAKMVAES